MGLEKELSLQDVKLKDLTDQLEIANQRSKSSEEEHEKEQGRRNQSAKRTEGILNDRIEALEGENKMLSQNIAKLEGRLRRVTVERSAAEDDKSKADTQIRLLESSLANVRKEKDTVVDDLKMQHKTHLATQLRDAELEMIAKDLGNQQMLKDLRFERDVLKKHVDGDAIDVATEFEKRVEQLREDRAKQRGIKGDKHREIVKNQKESYDSRIAELENKLREQAEYYESSKQSLQRDISRLMREKRELGQAQEDMTMDVHRRHDLERNRLEEQVKALTKDIADKNRKTDELTADIDKLRRTVDEVGVVSSAPGDQKGEKKFLQDKISRLERQMASMGLQAGDAIRDALEEAREAKEIAGDLGLAYEETQEDLKTLATTADANMKISKLETSSRQKEAAGLRDQQIAQLLSEIDILKKSASGEAIDWASALEAELNKVNQQHKADLDNQRKDYEQMVKNVKGDYLERIIALQDELRGVRTRALKDANAKQARVDSGRQEVQRLLSERADVSDASYNVLESQLMQMREQLLEKEMKIEELQKEQAKLERKVYGLQREKDDIVQDLNDE